MNRHGRECWTLNDFVTAGWVHDLLLHSCMVAGGVPVVENYPKKLQKLKNHSDLR